METLVIIAIVGFIAFVVYYNQKKEKAMIEAGEIVKRSNDFYDCAHIFDASNIDFAALLEILKEMDYTGTNVQKYFIRDSGHTMELHSSGDFQGKWIARIEDVEDEDGKGAIIFYFSNYEKYKGIPSLTSMNKMLTKFEKVLLTLDPSTTVKTERLKRKSKSKFF